MHWAESTGFWLIFGEGDRLRCLNFLGAMVPSAGSPFTLCKTNETSLFTIDKLRGCIFFQLVVIVILDAESFNRTTIIL